MTTTLVLLTALAAGGGFGDALSPGAPAADFRDAVGFVPAAPPAMAPAPPYEAPPAPARASSQAAADPLIVPAPAPADHSECVRRLAEAYALADHSQCFAQVAESRRLADEERQTSSRLRGELESSRRELAQWKMAPGGPRPAEPPSAPAVYSMTDSFGQTWTHQDYAYLASWVAQRNALTASPAAYSYPSVTYQYGAACASGSCYAVYPRQGRR